MSRGIRWGMRNVLSATNDPKSRIARSVRQTRTIIYEKSERFSHVTTPPVRLFVPALRQTRTRSVRYRGVLKGNREGREGHEEDAKMKSDQLISSLRGLLRVPSRPSRLPFSARSG